MVYLILAFVSSALVSIIMRLSDGRTQRPLGMLASNYLICTALAALGCSGGLFPALPGLDSALSMGIVAGVIFLAGFVLFRLGVQRCGVVLSSTFMKLGLLVTMVISVVFFGETPGPMQLLGFALAVGAIVLMNYRSGEGKFGLILILMMLCGGMADGMSKVFEELGNSALSGQFLFYTFGTALLLCLALAAVKKQLPGKAELLFGALIGIPNFYCSRFLLLSLSTVPGVIAYPVYSVAGILVVTLAGVVLFRERLEKRQWLALGIILAALVLLNV